MKKKNSQSSNHFLEFDEVKNAFKTDSNISYKSTIKSNSNHSINPFKENRTHQKNNSKKKGSNNKSSYLKALSSTQDLFNSPKRLKIFTILFLVLLIYFLYQPLLSLFYQYLFQYPTFAALFSDISREWLNRTLKGLFIMSFLGTLFFISLPSELIFMQYLSTSTNIIILVLSITLSNVLAMALNYGFGRFVGASLLRFFLKDKFEKYQNLTLNYGTFILILGNIIPGPIELLALLFGASKYDFKKYIYIVTITRIIKYGILIFIFYQFPEVIKYILI